MFPIINTRIIYKIIEHEEHIFVYRELFFNNTDEAFNFSKSLKYNKSGEAISFPRLRMIPCYGFALSLVLLKLINSVDISPALLN